MYGKLFAKMYEGTLYGQWEALVTFQQMIVLCDADGMLDMTPQAIAARTSIPLKIIEKGIGILESPDPHSRTPDQDGRRIERIDAHRPWGWHLVNHAKYSSMQDADTIRAQTRDRVRRHREKKIEEQGRTPDVTQVTERNAPKRHIDTDTDTKKEQARQRSRGSRLLIADLPVDWRVWCEQERPDLNPPAVWAAFHDFWIAKAGKDGVKLDWQATWRNWVRNEKRRPGSQRPGELKLAI